MHLLQNVAVVDIDSQGRVSRVAGKEFRFITATSPEQFVKAAHALQEAGSDLLRSWWAFSSVTMVSAVLGISLLPVSLSLSLNPHPTRSERHSISPVFLYSRIECEVVVFGVFLRESGDQLVQLVPSSL